MNIDYKAMRRICTRPIEYFERYGKLVTNPIGRYYYKDNGANILAVAHLDSVNEDTHFYPMTIRGQTVVYNARVDDRIGAYVILELLNQFNLNYDILLTEGEEIGKSTAQAFKTDKRYLWMFQFDRHGDDVVTYKYTSDTLKKMLRKAGFDKWEWGAFTDICELDELGCSGFNIGCGYHNEHTPWAYVNINVLVSQVMKFLNFYKKYQHTKIEYKPYQHKAGNQGGYHGWGTYGHPRYLNESEGYGWDDDDWKNHGRNTNERTTEEAVIEAEETAIVKMNICSTCTQEYRPNDNLLFSDICGDCEDSVSLCRGCSIPVLDSTLSEMGLCITCDRDTDSGISMASSLMCPGCNEVIWTDWFKKGECGKCSLKFTKYTRFTVLPIVRVKDDAPFQ